MKAREKRLKLYQQMSTKAYCTACGGIEIKDILYGIEDHVMFISDVNSNQPEPHRCKIHYDGEQSYFVCRGKRVYLSECLVV